MKILLVDTYYDAFLSSCYARLPHLERLSYACQREALLGQCFGTSNFYSQHLNQLGCEAWDVIVNSRPLQAAWAREKGAPWSARFIGLPTRTHRVPLFGAWLTHLPGLLDIAVAQVRDFGPDVLYCQDLSFFPPKVLADLKKKIGLVVGQIACPLPPEAYLRNYDLILTSFPHYVPRLRAKGIMAEYFRIGFEPRSLEQLGDVAKDIPVSFVGGISPQHVGTIPVLEYLAVNTPLEFFGYGASSLPSDSPIRLRHRGEVWGLDMFQVLARSLMTVNRHIDVAQEYANNMRLYEATGVGSLLITDCKQNLGELFEIGREVLCYSSKEEAAELINAYLRAPSEAQSIARAGQQRTLADHSYRRRMEELVPLLRGYLERRMIS